VCDDGKILRSVRVFDYVDTFLSYVHCLRVHKFEYLIERIPFKINIGHQSINQSINQSIEHVFVIYPLTVRDGFVAYKPSLIVQH
jgi:hypothetical protein